MATATTRPFLWVLVTAAVVFSAILVLSIADKPIVHDDNANDSSEGNVQLVDAGLATTRHLYANPQQADAEAPTYDNAAPRLRRGSEEHEQALAEYKAQSEEDQRRLGNDYAELERLWKRGRFTDRSPKAIAALEELVQRFGDTNRADCARYHLARLRKGGGPAGASNDKSETIQAFEQLAEKNSAVRCDTGAKATTMARFYLATQIYRFSNYQRSVEILRSLQDEDMGQWDNLDVPYALRARAILEDVDKSE
jgi:hypothetical protein